ncbi:MFS transporter [Paenibacillus sp. NFR01]|uniref:MFS transporter n=1 Tax=Paenibacillus sp. NFR01 TaxID=1566279 RepID=UPI0008B74EBB|nr:MFS transporter [Paenibacillus sp. NFR01]SET22122.1 glycoside/pentoside/hexuronide:cation symporter, GPH family [Paenibacillus sp. NFR01]
MQTTNLASDIPVVRTSEAGRSSKLTFKEKISYGLGDLGSNLMWGIVGSFLLYFYTDVALIPVAATGTLILVARILDSIIDPVIGGFVDRTNTRYGRARPYILFGIVPFAIMLILTFTSPDLSNTGKIIYASVTYIIAGLLYSIVNVPYGALMPMMTRSGEEKDQLSSYRMVGMAGGSIIVTALTTPMVKFFGGGNEQKGYLFTTIVFAVLSSIMFLIVFKNCKERYVEPVSAHKAKGSLIQTYKSAFKNAPWVSTIVFSLLLFIRTGATVSITIFFCLHVLHNPGMISILLPALYVSLLCSAAITPAFLKKFKQRKGNIIAQILFMIALSIMPFFEHNMAMFVGLWLVANIFGGISSGAVFSMIANSVDYNEWKFNNKSEGTLYAGYSFATKVGMALGSAVVGYTLAFTGYSAENVTAGASSAINVLFFAIPLVCTVLQIAAICFYKLDAIHPQVVRELDARRSAV